jgi:hypothetical protein
MGNCRSCAQQFNYIGMAVLSRKARRSVIELVLGSDVGTFVEEKLHHTRLA